MKRVFVTVLLILTLLVAFNGLLGQLVDPDFFWHLATGEWIVKNRALPVPDPFSYTTPGLLSDRERFILTQYWLAQAIYYAIYSFLGYNGIKLLGFVISGALILLMRLRYAHGGDPVLFLGTLFLGLLVILTTFPMERPQTISFLFFAILLYLLDRQVMDPSSAPGGLALLPALMLTWSNTHGGYLVGQAVILVYVTLEGLKVKIPQLGAPMEIRRLRRFAISGALALLASFVNPNGYGAVTVLLELPEYMTATIIEYAPPIQLLGRGFLIPVSAYLMILAVAGLAIVVTLLKRDRDIRAAVLFVGFGYFSWVSFRYVPFFLIWAVPFISRFMSGLRWRNTLRAAALLLPLVTFCYMLTLPHPFSRLANVRHFATGEWVDVYYPKEAARFIEAQDIEGNMYNHYNWGGYLIWRLGPERKVFIDGRGLYEYVYAQSVEIDNAAMTPEIKGTPFYRAMLDSYGINYVVTPFFSISGKVIPLVVRLMSDRDWKAVFAHGNSLIFVKDIPANYPLIGRYAIPPELLARELSGLLELMIREQPQDPRLYVAKGDILVLQGRFEEAEIQYKKALELYPFNETAKERLLWLTRQGSER